MVSGDDGIRKVEVKIKGRGFLKVEDPINHTSVDVLLNRTINSIGIEEENFRTVVSTVGNDLVLVIKNVV